MFVIELTYKSDLKDIDAHMTAHVKFLKKYYADGTFLVSGRKIPRDGGIILAVGKSKQEIETLLQEDPFHKHGLADFRVIEFRVPVVRRSTGASAGSGSTMAASESSAAQAMAVPAAGDYDGPPQ